MPEVQPTPIRDIEQYRADQVIYCVQGHLTKLYNPIPTPHGSLRNGELTDATGSMKITFVDLDMSLQRGQEIRVEATDSEKHGWVGCKLKEDGNYPLAIWVTGSASIKFPGGGQPSSNRRPQSAPRDHGDNRSQQPPPRNNGSRTRDTAPQTQTAQPARGDQLTRLDVLIDCYDTLRTLVAEKYSYMSDAPARDAIIAQALPTIYIEAAKSGIVANWIVGYERKKEHPAPPTDPREWRKCIVHSGANEGKSLEEVTNEDLMAYFKYYDEKRDNSSFAECIYAAAEERGLLHKAEPEPAETTEELKKLPAIPF